MHRSYVDTLTTEECIIHAARVTICHSPVTVYTSKKNKKTIELITKAMARKHNKPRPGVAHRGIGRFLGSDQNLKHVVRWSLRTFPENFTQIGPAVFS